MSAISFHLISYYSKPLKLLQPVTVLAIGVNLADYQ